MGHWEQFAVWHIVCHYKVKISQSLGRSMNNFKYLNLVLVLGFFACTQFLEDNDGKNTYTGDDGCVYCHTNDVRLKALAPVEDDGGGAGGG